MRLPPLLSLAAFLGLPDLVPSAEPPDVQARFLAGLPVAGTTLESLASQSAWQRHQMEFDSAWDKLEAGQISKIRAWTPFALGNDISSRDPLFYLFSGPDFLYANVFFPKASTYVFCGLEPVGAIPDVATIPNGGLASALSNLRKSLNAVLSFSFFITKEMKTDLRASHLPGTLPILYVFMARMQNTIRHVESVGLDQEGAFVDPAAKSAIPGVKIQFVRGAGAPQTLYYFATDLSNWGAKAKPGFLKFCRKLGDGNSLVKAASYLMHLPEFSDARGFLMNQSKTLVQDDSGIPVKYFSPDQWDVLLLGHYPGPIKMFENRFQPDLAAAFKIGNPSPLTFSFGYRWHPSESSVIVATSLRSVPKAMPVTTSKTAGVNERQSGGVGASH